ncbi:MAG: hypothetical protein ABFS37_10090 [Acidobacteriota bacterium]
MTPSTVTLLRLILLVAFSALLLASYLIERSGPRYRRWFTASFTILALASVAGYFNFGQFRSDGGFVNPWEHFHFFLGSKYLPEVGYDGLYVAGLTAINDRYPGAIVDTEVRDLMTFDMNTAILYFDQREAIKSRFTPERWAEFDRDLQLLSSNYQLPMAAILQDHGNTGSPAWAMAARIFTGPFPAGPKVLTAISFLDSVLLLVMFGFVWRAFGYRGMCIGLIVAMLTPRGYLFLGGSILRLDWLFALGMAMSFLKLKRYKTSGAFLAWAIASKPFCALFAVTLGFRFLWAAWKARTIVREHTALVLSSVVALILIVLLSSVTLGGFGIWTDYGQRITANLSEGHYNDNHSFNDVWLQFSNDWKNALFDWVPEVHAASLRDAREKRRHPSFVVARVLLVLLLLAVTTRHDDDVFAFSMGALCVFVVFVTNTYYWQMLCIPAIAFAQRYREDLRSFLYLLYVAVFLVGSYLFIQMGAENARHLQGYFGSIRLFVLCLLMVAVEVAWAWKARIGRGINPA